MKATIIEFNFMGNTNKNYEVFLNRSQIIHDFSKGNSIKIEDDSFKNENYIEEFNFFEEGNDEIICSFQMTVYRGIINHINYDKDPKQLSASLELLFFGKNFLPNKITYKGKDLNNFDNNNNKYRKRICIANADPNELEYLNDEKFKQMGFKFENDSYQINLRFAGNNNIHYSLSPFKKISEISKENEPVEELSINDEARNDLKEFCNDYQIFIDNFYTDYSLEPDSELDQVLLSDLQSLNDKYNKIKGKDIYKFLENPLDYKDIHGPLELVYYSHFLFEYMSIYKEEKTIGNFLDLKENIIENKLIIHTKFEALSKDEFLNEGEKVRILKTLSTILIKIIKTRSKVEGVELLNTKKISPENPYGKAIKLITEIIDNLDEDSRLFEAFMNFNSGKILNYLEKNEPTNYIIINPFGETIEDEYENYKTEFSLSLLNIEQIKSHLKKLIPKFIIRISTQINFRAYFDHATNIMVINELKMFGKKTESMNYYFLEKDADKYIIPIVMEIFHEMLSHGKIRIINKNQISPRFYRDSKKNFCYNSISKSIKTPLGTQEIIKIPESGRILENFISENPYIIGILKTPLVDNTEFLDYKWWIGDNFNYIESKIKQRNNVDNFSGNNMLIDEFEIDNLDDCYIDRGNKYIA